VVDTEVVRGRLVLAIVAAVVAAAFPLTGVSYASWWTYHGDLTRQGDTALGPLRPIAPGWTSPVLDGMVYAEPLVVGSHVYVATENDSIYALDATTGQIIWRTNVGTPVPLSSLPCGNIDPLGITGTPVIDTATGLLYAVAEVATPTLHHELVAIDTNQGSIVMQRSADPSGLTPTTQQQRPALALANGNVYWAYGGLAGDCGNYHGWVVGSSTSLTGPLLAYQVPTQNEGAIWGTPGPSVDGAGNLYVTTGNGSNFGSLYDHGNSLIKLDPNLNELGAFAPTNWGLWSSLDADLGSTGALLLPGGLVFAIGKQQVGFLVDGTNLAGTQIGDAHALATLNLTGCAAFGGDAYAAPYIYVPCAGGVRAVKLDTSVSPPTLTPAWAGPIGTKGSPIVADGAVWVVDYDAGWLYVLDPATGAQLQSRLAVGHARHFTSVATGTGRVFVAADTTIKAFNGPAATAPTPPHSWSGWDSPVPLTGGAASGPAVASWGPDRLDLFATAGGQLQHTCWTGTTWCNWENLGGALQDDPAAVSWGPNRVDVFARGTDNQLWHKWWDGSGWRGWEPLGGQLTSGPAAASWSANRLDVFVRGTDNQLWHKWWDGSGWRDWEPLGGVLNSDPAAVSWGPNRVDVFVRGTDNQLWHKDWG